MLSRAGVFASSVAAVDPIIATFQTSAVSTADLSVYTFASQAIGTASVTRRVVVAVATRTAGFTSATIGGISASIDRDFEAGNDRMTFVSAVVPTGTTADVVVTLSGSPTRCGIGVWSLSHGSPTGQTGTSSAASPSTSVTTFIGEVLLAAAVEHGTVGTTVTWTGATERYDGTVEGDIGHTGADVSATTNPTNVSLAWSATTGGVLVAVAYGA